MTIPQIFTVIEPASVQIFTGAVPVEIADMYPVLITVTVQTGRNVPGAGTLELTLGRDETGAYPVLDGGYFERWKPIRIVADFGTYTEDVLWGHIVKITPDYPADRGAAKVTIEFQDQTIAMDRAEVTKDWGEGDSGASISDRQILSTILIDYGHALAPDSADGQSRAEVTQDKTDFRFASALAEAVGYEMRLMFGEMYFGPINLSGEPQAPILVYAGPDTNCLEFSLEEEAAVPDSALTAAIDDTGAAAETLVSPDLPILGAQSASEAAETGGVPEFIWRLSDAKDAPADAAAMLAQAKINEASLSIVATCTVDSTIYGHVLLPGKLVTVDGIGVRYGGRFYVDTVEHVFAADGYTQTARLLKNGINEG